MFGGNFFASFFFGGNMVIVSIIVTAPGGVMSLAITSPTLTPSVG